MRLRLLPLTLRQANGLVGKWHRHHQLAIGHRWSIGVALDGELVGAAIVGRPVARQTPQYSIAEVSRLVTDGHQNACSKLYSACARAAAAMGFEEIQTFILASESGVSLKAAGWSEDPKPSKGGDWNRPSRGGRRSDQPQEKKRRWFKRLSGWLLFAALAHASTIPTPDLTTACDGWTASPHCVTGTVVYFRGGIPQTEMLKPSPAYDAPVNEVPVIDAAPPVPPRLTIAPEPAELPVLLGLLGGMGITLWGRRRG